MYSYWRKISITDGGNHNFCDYRIASSQREDEWATWTVGWKIDDDRCIYFAPMTFLAIPKWPKPCPVVMLSWLEHWRIQAHKSSSKENGSPRIIIRDEGNLKWGPVNVLYPKWLRRHSAQSQRTVANSYNDLPSSPSERFCLVSLWCTAPANACYTKDSQQWTI